MFSGAIAEGEAVAGEMVEVCDASGAKLGQGWYSPASQIRVRIVPDAPIADLVAEAVGRRAAFYADDAVTAIRLVNAGFRRSRHLGFSVAPSRQSWWRLPRTA